MARGTFNEELSGVPLFAGFSRKQLAAVSNAGTLIDVEAGNTLISEGDYAREAYVIVRGDVTVRRSGSDIAQLGPGAIVGELGLFAPFVRNATVDTKTDGVVLVLNPPDFMRLVQNEPPLGNRVLGSLARRIRELDTKAYG